MAASAKRRLLVGSHLSRHCKSRKWQVVNSQRHERARLSNDERHRDWDWTQRLEQGLHWSRVGNAMQIKPDMCQGWPISKIWKGTNWALRRTSACQTIAQGILCLTMDLG
jgi:hypothetical protein